MTTGCKTFKNFLNNPDPGVFGSAARDFRNEFCHTGKFPKNRLMIFKRVAEDPKDLTKKNQLISWLWLFGSIKRPLAVIISLIRYRREMDYQAVV